MQALLKWMTAAPVRTVAVVTVLGAVRLLDVLSGGVIALVALRHGASWAAGVASAAAALLALVGLATGRGVWVLVVPALAMWLPSLALGALLRRTVSLSLTVQAACAVACAGVIAFLGFTPDPEGVWRKWLADAFLPLLEGVGGKTDAIDLTALARLATGMMATSFLLLVTLALIVGRFWQAVLDNPGGFGREFRAFANGRVATLIVSVIFVAAPLTKNLMLENVAIVLIVPFLYQGLAVAHAMVWNRGLHGAWLTPLYLGLVLLPLPTVAALAGVGYLDNWFSFRAAAGRNG
ncbi:MAG TPA: hypothetical protein VNL72_01600 [Gammaproteobacteria bacterium]|nr:hypothetical protein [Gammaproteobacteria bacterium]